MTTAQREGRITTTEVSVATSGPINSTAPNGSSSSVDYWTAVVSKQTWTMDERNGVYAGRSYKITDRYISNTPDYRGQFVSSSSEPWKD